MTQLTKQQAAMLYAYDYKMVDKEGREYRIVSITESGLSLFVDYDSDWKPVLFSRIGTDYFILARPLSSLTTEIEHNGEKFVPIHKLFDIEYAGTSHVENVRNQYFSNTGRFVSSSHFGTASDTSVNVLNIESNNYWKMNKLHEWHFALGFPEHTVKHLI